MSFRKQVFNKVGLFDRHFGPGSVGCCADDVEFIYRALKKNTNIIICNDIIIIHEHRKDTWEEFKLIYRDYKAHIIFWLKYIIQERDAFAFKNACTFLVKTTLSLFTELITFNKYRIALQIVKAGGALVGLVKGMYIWLILAPIQTQCQKSA